MTRLKALTAIVFLLLPATACSAMRGPTVQREGATLTVENRSTYDVTVYALRSTQRIRLGQATALRATELRIPSYLVNGSPLRFQGNPIGLTREPISQEIVVWPGDNIEMIIPPM